MDYALLALVICVAVGINLPFGAWRTTTRKFSVWWFLSIHLPIPAIFVIRPAAGFGWDYVPVMVACAATGQLAGGWLFHTSVAPIGRRSGRLVAPQDERRRDRRLVRDREGSAQQPGGRDPGVAPPRVDAAQHVAGGDRCPVLTSSTTPASASTSSSARRRPAPARWAARPTASASTALTQPSRRCPDLGRGQAMELTRLEAPALHRHPALEPLGRPAVGEGARSAFTSLCLTELRSAAASSTAASSRTISRTSAGPAPASTSHASSTSSRVAHSVSERRVHGRVEAAHGASVALPDQAAEAPERARLVERLHEGAGAHRQVEHKDRGAARDLLGHDAGRDQALAVDRAGDVAQGIEHPVGRHDTLTLCDDRHADALDLAQKSPCESCTRKPGIDSSLSSVPPVWPRPRPDILPNSAPHEATSGASTRVTLSPTPPLECLSSTGRPSTERSSALPLSTRRARDAEVSAAEKPRSTIAMSSALAW